ncbi:hypothetical protein LASUN_13490 [Lentilactobacillus sunkii]|uniref:IrrE N-terminal-like domain-containing protein n=1 Tax=Lentilactobacillus sunkii TaxID=481719 RepID=A0A1E7XCN2_9LACO|nr:ImmA/IrrE family metallo-endopeptidase [Lentilactobacillus sunkii]OFA10799.1 hypothetical protein LASUN_13490 [Lentilactobacillus sunkii]
MDDIERLMSQYPQISYHFEKMPSGLRGLTIGDEITINSTIPKDEQLEWLYEEIGHVLTSSGDITNYHIHSNVEQEIRARNWGMKHQVPLEKLREMAQDHVDEDYEIADDLGIQIDYLHMVGFMYGFKYKETK